MTEIKMAKILIAEDEADIRELIKLTLSFGGFDVAAAENEQQAVELAQLDTYDLILMDVQMPILSGYEACRAMKEIPELKDVPVIFLSAKGQSFEVNEGLEAGAVDYVLKPFDPSDLVRRINQVLESGAKPEEVL